MSRPGGFKCRWADSGAEAASEKNLQHQTLFELHECALSRVCCQQTALQDPTGSEQMSYVGL